MSISLPTSKSYPSVLVFAGLDPTGGAGISADIETLSYLKVHPLPIVTCLTVQDTINVKRLEPVDAHLLQQQLDTLKDDIGFNVIKLGLLSSLEIIDLVYQTIKTQIKIPVVFDPILRAGGGANLMNNKADSIIKAMREKIIPYCSIITPNSLEARLLTNKENLDDCAKVLFDLGCENSLITGEHEHDPQQITNILYTADEIKNNISSTHYHWPRLPNQYHGSGCTLASAISGYLAKGCSIKDAVQQAQDFTNSTLQNAIPLGQGQYHPNRFFDI